MSAVQACQRRRARTLCVACGQQREGRGAIVSDSKMPHAHHLVVSTCGHQTAVGRCRDAAYVVGMCGRCVRRRRGCQRFQGRSIEQADASIVRPGDDSKWRPHHRSYGTVGVRDRQQLAGHRRGTGLEVVDDDLALVCRHDQKLLGWPIWVAGHTLDALASELGGCSGRSHCVDGGWSVAGGVTLGGCRQCGM